MKVLLIEDNPQIQGFVKHLFGNFTGAGYDLVIEGSLGEGLRHLAGDHIGLLLLDLNLPDSTGIETFQSAYREAGDIPIIILTGIDDDRLALQAIEGGAQDYLVKGQVDGESLKRAMRYAVERHRIRQELKKASLSLKKGEEALSESREKLLASENLYRTILNAAGAATAILDGSGMILHANAEAEPLFGYTPQELEGKIHWSTFVPPDELPRLTEYWRLLHEDPASSSQHYEARLVDRRGRIRYGILTVKLIPNTRNCVVSITDITERKQMEEALIQRENTLEILLNAPMDLMGLLDADGLVLAMNETGARIMGKPVGDIVGHRVEDLFPPEIARNRMTHLRRVVDTGQPAEFGDERGGRYFLNRMYPIFNPQHTSVGQVAVFASDITARRKAEEALRESEEKFRTVIEHIPDLVLVHRDGIVQYINPGTLVSKVLGYTPEEVIGKPILDYVAPECHARVIDATVRRMRGDPVEPYELVILSSTGRRTFVVSGSRIDFGGRPAILNVLTDIDDRKKAEIALRESEEQYRAVVESQTEFITRFTPDFRVTFVNDAYCTYFGIRRDEIVGKRFKPCIPEEDLESVRRHFATLSLETPVATIEHRTIKPDGQVKWQKWVDRAIYNEKGVLVEYQSVGRDTTERKRAEEALRESEEKYRSLVERANDGIAILQDGFVRFVNQNQARFWGGSPEEIVGRPFTDFVHPDERPRLLERYKKRISGEQAIPVYETVLLRKDGGEFPAELSAGLISFQGRPADLVIIRDITKRKESEEALRESEARLNAVVQGSPIPQFVIGRDHRIIYWNRALEELSRIKAAEMVGTTDQWKAFYPEQRPVLADLLVDGAVLEIPAWYEGKYRRSPFIDGAFEAVDRFPSLHSGEGWLFFTAAPIRDTKGNVIGAVETLEDITDRKRAEEALRESEERFKTLFEDSAAPQLLMDNGVVIDCNAAFLALFALEDKETVLGHTPDEFAPEFQPDGVPSKVRGDEIVAAILEKGTARYEWAHLKHDAARTPILCDVNCNVITIDGKLLIHAVILDITDQKRAELALRESEEKYRDLAEASRDIIYIIDHEDTIVYVNSRALEFLGKGIDEVVGRQRTLFFPAGASQMKKNLDRVFSTGENFRAENPIPSPAGITWQDTTLTPLRNPDGTVTRVLGISRDITERKRIEEALKESEEKYRNLVERANDGIVVIQDGIIIFCNHRIGDFWGGDIAEITGKPMVDFVAPPAREKTGEFYLRAMSGGILPDRFETTLLRKDGSLYPAELTPGIITFRGKPAALVVIRDITERKKVEEALKASEVYLKSIFNSVQTGLLLIDPVTHVITDANLAAARMFGAGIEELVGSVCHRFICPAEEGKCPITDPGQRVDNSERIFLRSDGTRVPILKTVAPITIAGRNYLLESFIDITGLKRAQEALRESEERYRTVIETANEAIVVAQDGIMKFSNPQAVEMLESTPEYIASVPFTEFIHPEDVDMVADRYSRRVRGEDVPSGYDFRFLGKKGRVTWVHISAVRITWDGRPAILNFLMDVTERRKIEQALKDSEEMFRNPVEQSPVGVYLFQDGAIKYTNRRLSEMFGYSREEAAALSFEQIIHPDDLRMVGEEIACWLQGGAGPRYLTLKGVKKDGTPLDLEIYCANMTYQGRPATYGTVIDITGRKQMESQIRESLKEKEVLLREIHHRVKNNMQVISSLLSVQAQNITDEMVRGLFKESQNRIRSIALVHELLYRSDNLDQIEYGTYLKRMFIPLFESYSVDQRKVSMAIDAHDVMVTIEKAVPCSLIVNELISNSLKHGFPGDRKGEIRIGFSLDDKASCYTLDYRDNGVGLPEGMDLAACTTLGMRLIQGLTKQLRGTIAIDSRDGSHFRITFPAGTENGGSP